MVIHNSIKKAARIYYTVSATNTDQFPQEVVDKAEREYDRIFNDSSKFKSLYQSGLFKEVDGYPVITPEGERVAKEEVEASRRYIESRPAFQPKNNYRDNGGDFKKDFRPKNLLHEVIAADPSTVIIRTIYGLQKLHSLDVADKASDNGKPGDRLRRVIEAALNGGEETVSPKARDKNGKPITQRTGFCFGREYTQDSFGKVLFEILKDNGMINDCCDYVELPTE